MVSANTELTYNSKIEGDVIVSRADAVINWIRSNSMWPMPMGLACCAIELMATGASRFDIARFGAEVMRFSPKQSDVMIVAGHRDLQDGVRRCAGSTTRWPSRSG
jgi:NADH-quinone oxidoreductase subunit B